MIIMGHVVWVMVSALLLSGSLETAFGQAAQVSKGGVPVVTVWDALCDLSRYNGQSIIMVGRSGGTSEGSWLSEDCEHKIVTDGHTWDNIMSTEYAFGTRDNLPGYACEKLPGNPPSAGMITPTLPSG